LVERAGRRFVVEAAGHSRVIVYVLLPSCAETRFTQEARG
jgi:hypothetical protein